MLSDHEKEAGYFDVMKALQKAAPRSMRPAITRASNAVASPKTQMWMHNATDGLTTDGIVFGEGGLQSLAAIPDIVAAQGMQAIANPTVWTFPTYTGFQELAKGMKHLVKKAPDYLPGTERHVSRLARPIFKSAAYDAGYAATMKVAGVQHGFVRDYFTRGGGAIPTDILHTAGMETVGALPFLGYMHSSYEGLQDEVPEAYRPAALTGGGIGAAGAGAAGMSAAGMALLLARKRGLQRLGPRLAKFLKPGVRGAGEVAEEADTAADILLPAIGGTLAAIPGYELGERAGVGVAREFAPDAYSELKHKLGI